MGNEEFHKILVLGATGMLGHKLIQVLSKKFNALGTVRDNAPTYSKHPILGQMHLFGGISAENIDSVRNIVREINPDVVVNCIGIVKQLPQAHNAIASITVNALFPHQLAKICENSDCRLIHYSTDCVFSGGKGNYTEGEFADADDLYGRTKYLGEVGYENCLTLRTSIIGRELGAGHSLVDWFFSQKGKTIQGYKKAIFSGLTTLAHGQILVELIEYHSELKGIWHLSGDPISKFDLLNMIKERYNLDITIIPDETVIIDRSLDSSKFKEKTGIKVPTWEKMISDMYFDESDYSFGESSC